VGFDAGAGAKDGDRDAKEAGASDAHDAPTSHTGDAATGDAAASDAAEADTDGRARRGGLAGGRGGGHPVVTR
jgi:hypothetical protein